MILSYIAAGSNLGDRLQNIQEAKRLLENLPTIKILRSSSVYETEAVGGPPGQGKYLNAVWEIEARLAAATLLQQLLEIEHKLGRVRDSRHGPRPIDLDILFFGDFVCDIPGLKIPHPRLQEREFVLRPLMDLCPQKNHPVLQKNMEQLYSGIARQEMVPFL